MSARQLSVDICKGSEMGVHTREFDIVVLLKVILLSFSVWKEVDAKRHRS